MDSTAQSRLDEFVEYARAGATGGQFSDLAGRAVPLYRRAAGDASDHQHWADSAGSRQRTTAPGIVPACGAAAFYGAAGADLSAECVNDGHAGITVGRGRD